MILRNVQNAAEVELFAKKNIWKDMEKERSQIEAKKRTLQEEIALAEHVSQSDKVKLETITEDIWESKVKITSIDSEIMKLSRQKDQLNKHVREQTIKEKAQRSKHLLQEGKIKEQRVKLQEMRTQVTEMELAMVNLAAAPGFRCQNFFIIQCYPAVQKNIPRIKTVPSRCFLY